jgi:hypothetical protein
MHKSLTELVSICINKDYHNQASKSTTSKPATNKQIQLYEKAKKTNIYEPSLQTNKIDIAIINKMLPSYKKVLGALITLSKTIESTGLHDNKSNNKIWLSAKSETIAKRAGVSVRTYFHAVNYFIEQGYIERYKCNNTNGLQNKYAPVFFKITLSPSAIKKTVMLITSFFQLLSFTKPLHTEVKLKGDIYINNIMGIKNTPLLDSVNTAKKTLSTPITHKQDFFIKKVGKQVEQAKIKAIVNELVDGCKRDTTTFEMQKQAKTLLYRDLKGTTITDIMVEDVVKQVCALVSQKRSQANLYSTKQDMPCSPISYVKHTPKTNDFEPQVNRTPFELILFSQKHNIPLTVEIIDTYSKISDDAERESYKRYIKFLAYLDSQIERDRQ